MAVGKDKLRDDAKQAWVRLCKCLGQDFLPYMNVVMPPLLLSAQHKPDVTIKSADSNAEIDESDDERLVYMAKDSTTGEIVALKKIRLDKEQEGVFFSE